MCWSPHTHGLLATGGGTADRWIRIWDTLTNERIGNYETGSQVWSMIFSKSWN